MQWSLQMRISLLHLWRLFAVKWEVCPRLTQCQEKSFSDAIYLTYMHGVHTMTRAVLYMALSFLKRYPKSGQFVYLCARGQTFQSVPLPMV